MIRNRNSLHLGNKDEQKMQTVAGIKEVEEVDALVIDDDDSMNFPPNIRINNRWISYDLCACKYIYTCFLMLLIDLSK